MQEGHRNKTCCLLPLGSDATKSLLQEINQCLSHSEIFKLELLFSSHALSFQWVKITGMVTLKICGAFGVMASFQILTMNWHPSDINISEERSTYYRNIFLLIEKEVQVSGASAETISPWKELLGWPTVVWNQCMGGTKLYLTCGWEPGRPCQNITWIL